MKKNSQEEIERRREFIIGVLILLTILIMGSLAWVGFIQEKAVIIRGKNGNILMVEYKQKMYVLKELIRKDMKDAGDIVIWSLE